MFALGSIVLASAQRIIPLDELAWETEYTPETVKDEVPDSVYVFYYWGDGSYNEDQPDTTLDVAALLKCRNLQKLTLRDIPNEMLIEVVAHLDNFPLLQKLELTNCNLVEFPEKIYKLRALKTLSLSYIDNFVPDSAALAGNVITELVLDNVNAGCDEENTCEIRFDLFPELTVLNVNNSNINYLKSISQCHKLTSLNLSYLPAGALDVNFSELPQLQNLVLAGLSEAYDTPVGLGSLSNLTDLTIEFCAFSLDESGIENAKAIERLAISEIGETNFDFVARLTSLKYLDLHSNTIVSLPNEIASCKLLEYVNLSSNIISQLPEGFYKLGEINYLDLEYNQFQKIPASMGNFKKLETLYLSQNPLTMIEKGAFNLPALQYLQMNNCPIASLPDDFGNLPSLRMFGAYGDSLETLPPSFFKLTSVQSLDLSSNKFKKLPEGWASLTDLYSVNLDYNKLSELPASLFLNASLKRLLVSHNQIKSLPKTMVKSPELTTIFINDNAHVKFPKGADKMAKIEYVYVNQDDFTEKELAALKKMFGEKLQISDSYKN